MVWFVILPSRVQSREISEVQTSRRTFSVESESALSEAWDVKAMRVPAAFGGAVQGHGWVCSSAVGSGDQQPQGTGAGFRTN